MESVHTQSPEMRTDVVPPLWKGETIERSQRESQSEVRGLDFPRNGAACRRRRDVSAQSVRQFLMWFWRLVDPTAPVR